MSRMCGPCCFWLQRFLFCTPVPTIKISKTALNPSFYSHLMQSQKQRIKWCIQGGNTGGTLVLVYGILWPSLKAQHVSWRGKLASATQNSSLYKSSQRQERNEKQVSGWPNLEDNSKIQPPWKTPKHHDYSDSLELWRQWRPSEQWASEEKLSPSKPSGTSIHNIFFYFPTMEKNVRPHFSQLWSSLFCMHGLHLHPPPPLLRRSRHCIEAGPASEACWWKI